MSSAIASTTQAPENSAKAVKLDRGLRLLLASPAERAFESGHYLNQIHDEGHHAALGFESFKAYVESLQEAKIRPATAYANMKVARKFEMAIHGHFGIGKLRLLAADHVADPLRLIDQGMVVSDGQGGQVVRPISEIPCKELAGLLASMCPAPERKGGRKKAVSRDSALKCQTMIVAGILLSSTAEAPIDVSSVAPPSDSLVITESSSSGEAASPLATLERVMNPSDADRRDQRTEVLASMIDDAAAGHRMSVEPVTASDGGDRKVETPLDECDDLPPGVLAPLGDVFGTAADPARPDMEATGVGAPGELATPDNLRQDAELRQLAPPSNSASDRQRSDSIGTQSGGRRVS